MALGLLPVHWPQAPVQSLPGGEARGGGGWRSPLLHPREDEGLSEALAFLSKSFLLPSFHPPDSVGGSGPYPLFAWGQTVLGRDPTCLSKGTCVPTLNLRDSSPGSSQDSCVIILATSGLRPSSEVSLCPSLARAVLASRNLGLSSWPTAPLLLSSRCGVFCPASLRPCVVLCPCLSPSASVQASWYPDSYLGAEVSPGLSHALPILELSPLRPNWESPFRQ